jgi:hypothetical protein
MFLINFSCPEYAELLSSTIDLFEAWQRFEYRVHSGSSGFIALMIIFYQ